jgi:hypothetical protein
MDSLQTACRLAAPRGAFDGKATINVTVRAVDGEKKLSPEASNAAPPVQELPTAIKESGS